METKNGKDWAAHGGDGQLPDELRSLLRTRFGADVEPKLFAQSDVTAEGRFGLTWAVMLGDQLVVIDPNGSGAPDVRAVPLDDQVEVEIVEGVGCSRFRIVRDGQLVEELRFSRRQAKRFSRLLHVAEAKTKSGKEADEHERTNGDSEKLCGTCGRLIPDWTDTCPRCLHNRKILWRLMAFTLPYKRWLIVGVVSAVLLTLLQLVPPKLTKYLINDVLQPGAGHPEWLWPLIGILAVVVVLRVLMNYLRLNRMARLSELMTRDLRKALFEHIQKLSLSFYSKKPTGELISRITHDTDRLWDFIAFGVMEATLSVLVIVCIAVILFIEEPMLAALTMLPVPIALVLTYYHTRAMRRVFRKMWSKWSRMTSVLSDVIPGARVVKAFTQEQREAGRFGSRNDTYVEDAMILHKEWTTYWPKVMFLLNIGTVVIWSYAAPRVRDGSFDLGTFIEFLGYMWMFYGPIEQLGMMNRMFQRAMTSAQRVFDVLDTQPTIYSKATPVRRPRIDGRVTFENVSFSYDGVKRVLKQVSFDVEPGEMIGLAGPSGSGKTTMVNLICRFYDLDEGRILIDGTDVRDLDLHELRSQVGIVLQEPYLFCGTIAENIRYGSPESSTDALIAAARAANAHDFVVGMPDGYDTMVGERGHTLSGGERQRVSIARAILKSPRILILDEATSSVDTNTESKIQQAIGRLVKGRTTFAIAHRLSTLRRADRLFILDKGQLIEQGTHEQLLANKGLYADLHQKQTELQA